MSRYYYNNGVLCHDYCGGMMVREGCYDGRDWNTGNVVPVGDKRIDKEDVAPGFYCTNEEWEDFQTMW